MIKCAHVLPSLLIAVLATTSEAAPIPAEVIELDAAEVFIEFNFTDGDFGIQFFWDGEAWRSMSIRGPNGSMAPKVTEKKTT